MQVLLLQDREDVRDKISFLIESGYQSKVYGAKTVAEALEVLANAKPTVHLVLFDLKSCTDAEKEPFWTAVGRIPVVYCPQSPNEQMPRFTNATVVPNRSELIDVLVSLIEGMVGPSLVGKKGEAGAPISDTPLGADDPKSLRQSLCRIKTLLLLTVSPLRGDIFIKINENKFVKVFKAGDVFDRADLERYTIKKGIEYLHIRREDCLEFADKYRNELQKLLGSDNLTVGKVEKLGGVVHEVIQELHNQIGFTKEVQDLAKTQVQLTLKAMGKDPDLVDILKKLRASGEKYISSHSMLCSYLACAIAKQLKWSSATTYYKLSLASFLHDITLTNHELAIFNTLQELEQKKSHFTEAEIKAFKEHPIIAADLARRMNEVPPDVDTIIVQHHENDEGTGFPRKLGATQVAPLAAVFIVAHDLTQYTMRSGENFSAEEFLKKGREKYTRGHFKKVLMALEGLKDFKELLVEAAAQKPS